MSMYDAEYWENQWWITFAILHPRRQGDWGPFPDADYDNDPESSAWAEREMDAVMTGRFYPHLLSPLVKP